MVSEFGPTNLGGGGRRSGAKRMRLSKKQNLAQVVRKYLKQLHLLIGIKECLERKQ